MGQFDNFKSITLMLAGVFVISFGIINFLNIEIQSRSNHGIKMRNENLFEVLGRKISEMIATLREKNSHRRSLLYHLFTQENSTRSASSMRKLQSFAKDPSSRAEHNSNRNRHRLRHGKNSKRLTELFLRDKNNSMLSKMLLHLDGDDGLVAVSRNVSNRRSVPANNEINRDNLEEGLDVHDHCYTTNDVLEIIALTCLVNFIFWFLIISCVNMFTRNQKMWKCNSFESLTSIDSGSDFEFNNQTEAKAGGWDLFIPNQQNFLKNYVNSLTNELEGTYPENEPCSLEGSSLGKKLNAQRNHQRLRHLSNTFFDTVSSVNLKPVTKKNLVSRKKSNRIVNSFSMEDLFF